MNWSQLDTVLEVVNKLKATNSNKDKLAILKSYIGHEDEKMICKVLNYTYDTFKKLNCLKVYPNDLCPCGSGKKYKKCCGKRKNN